jgi:hypothetical protein
MGDEQLDPIHQGFELARHRGKIVLGGGSQGAAYSA